MKHYVDINIKIVARGVPGSIVPLNDKNIPTLFKNLLLKTSKIKCKSPHEIGYSQLIMHHVWLSSAACIKDVMR